jgi:hypothetical protein
MDYHSLGDLTPQQYQEALDLVISVCMGKVLPGELEARLKDLEKYTPLAGVLGGVLAKALQHHQNWQDLSPNERAMPENISRFLTNNEVVCRTQGAIAVLLGVGEILQNQTQASEESTVPGKKKTEATPAPTKAAKTTKKAEAPAKETKAAKETKKKSTKK